MNFIFHRLNILEAKSILESEAKGHRKAREELENAKAEFAKQKDKLLQEMVRDTESHHHSLL